jgi:TonB-linked SusC/RagA family outer membrane protein
MKKRIKFINWNLLQKMLFIVFFSSSSVFLSGQVKTVTGTVTDQTGEAVIGARIDVKGSTEGTVSDLNGKFSLQAAPNATLVISYVGYKKQEIAVGNRANINVTLTEDTQLLDEVTIVNVGYGTVKKASMVGSVAALNAKDIETIPVGQLTNALAGRFAGVTISQSDGGTPGGSSNVVVGARGTWNNTDPLYVIDGIIRDKTAFDVLSQADIESFSVLKDAAAATVYGSRAANGVVLVTTKKGKAGKPTVTYSGSVGAGEFAYQPEPESWASRLHATQIGQMEYRGVKAAGTAVTADGWSPKHASVYANGHDATGGYIRENNPVFSDEAIAYYSDPAHHYSALDDVYRTPITTQHSVNVSGGNDLVTYYVGGNYYNESGIFKALDYSKYSIRSNVETKITKDLKLSLSMNTDNSERTRASGQDDRMSGVYRNLVLASTLTPTMVDGKYVNRDPSGNSGGGESQVAIANGDLGLYKRTTVNTEYTAALQYDLPWIKGLSAKVMYNRYVRNYVQKDQQKPITTYALKKDPNDPTQTTILPEINETNGALYGSNYVEEKTQYDRYYQFNTQLDYANTFGKHAVSATLVYERAESNGENLSGKKQDYEIFERPYLDYGGSNRDRWSLSNIGWESGRISYIGRLNYTFDNKYLIEGSFRQDLSSKFGPTRKNRAGFFPSGAVAWRVSEEKFFQDNVPFINNLKLRASVGLIGNDEIDAAQWYNKANINVSGMYTGGTTNANKGTAFSVIPNYGITWEESAFQNYGVDLGFLKNMFTLSGEYWFKHTYDILGSTTTDTPDVLGGQKGAENYGIIDAYGFTFELGFNKQINKDLSLWARGNFGWADNKLIRYAESNVVPWLSKLGLNYDRIAGYLSDGIIWTMKDTGRTDGNGVKLYDITTSTGGKYTIPANYHINESSHTIDNGNYNSLRPGWVFFKDLGGVDADGNRTDPDGYRTNNDADKDWKITRMNPPINYGLTLGGNWKGLSLEVFLQGTAGNQKAVSLHNIADCYWSGNAWEFWTGDVFSAIDNPTGKYPLLVNGPSDANMASDFWIHDASFIRLKNVTLAYDLPKSLLAKAGISGAKVYVSGNNLALLWNPFKYYDPEMGGYSDGEAYRINNPAPSQEEPLSGINTYPLTRTVTFGLTVSF